MRFFVSFVIVIVFCLFVTNGWIVFGQIPLVNSTSQNKLSVSFVNNVAPSYEADLDPNEKFILSQSYSWIRDQNSRYNLVSYSIDGEDFVPISRLPRGNFTLDIPTSSSHSIVFLAVTQYPLSVEGTDVFSFLPESPTNDNWFDAESEVSITVTPPSEGLIPYELDGWEGPIIKSDANSAQVLVDAPTSIEVKWKQNYLPLTSLVIIPIAGIAAFFAIRSRRISKISQKETKLEIKTGKKQVEKGYYDELRQYTKKKALEKLDWMRDSKLMTDAKHSQIKGKLEEID